MYFFPEWSDLGSFSDPLRLSWEQEFSVRERFRRYFDGDVFNEKVETDQPVEDAPLLYPDGLNLVKMLCVAQTDAEMGEWQDQVITFNSRADESGDASVMDAIQLLNDIYQASDMNSALWEICLDRNIYGGGVLKISADLRSPGHVKWSRVPLQNFFPVFDPDNPNDLLEAYVVTLMTSEQAAAKYGFKSVGGTVTRVEKWSKSTYENLLDGTRIDAYSGVNPWGFVPFEYIPRFRSSNWWGESLTQDIIPAQDQLNMTVADVGDALNANSHPILYGFNLPRGFNAKNFPVGPSAMWDLGRVIGNSPEPKVAALEVKNPVPNGSFEYVQFLYDWARTSSFAPPVTFGEDSDGSQRSGATLEIRMWPMVKSVRRSRSYLIEGMTRAILKTGRILEQKNFSDVGSRAVSRIVKRQIVPVMNPILPKDHQAVVDEIVKLFSMKVPGISLETAQKELGRGFGEVDRIRNMIQDKELYPHGLQDKPEKAKADAKTPEEEQEGLKGKIYPQGVGE